MKRTISKITLQCFLLLSITISYVFAQNGTACYKPFTGTGKVATPIQSTAVCVNCTFLNNASNATDNSTENFAEFNDLASVLANNGITVKDTVSTYPAGFFAGYVVDLGSPTLLSANVLNAFVISTYNDGVLAETKNKSNGLAVATVAGNSQGRVYLNFKTTLPFDEIRFTFSGAITGLSTFRIFYATAFDPNCGTMDQANVCDDQVAGSKTHVTFNAGSVAALTSITNPLFITDGDKSTFANVTVPVGTSLLGNPPYVGVLDEQRMYPGGQRVGFVIRYQSSLLTADVLSSFRLETYLFGVLQEQSNIAGNTLKIDALGIGNNDKTISFNTTKMFNEARLVFNQTVNANIGTVGVNYMFEEPTTCTACRDMIMASQPATTPYMGTISASRTGLIAAAFPAVCVGGSLTNTGFVTDNIMGNYATYTAPTAGLNCGANLSVKLSGAVPANSFAGFIIAKAGGIISASALGDVTITTYLNGTAVGSSIGNNLLGASLLSIINGDSSFIGFKAGSSFDEIQITITNTLSLNLGAQFRIYNAFVTRDDDGDGVEDCKEVCGAGNDAIDTDGDGIPDGCDTGLETPLNLKVLLQGALLSTPALAKDLMRADLNTLGFIPLQQPYSSTLNPRFAQVGGGGAEVVTSSVLNRSSILSNILVDWVLVEIRDSINPATVRKTVSALVARNGEIVDTLGGPLMVSLPAGHYYISVKHRNHLGVMTGTAVVTAGAVNSIDFSTLTPAQLYGNGAIARIQVLPGIYALWAGDVNSDGKVKYQGPNNDANPVLNGVLTAAPNIGVFSYNYDNLLGYFRSDVDLSGKAKYQGPFNDVNTILTNILLFSPNQPAFNYNYDFLTEQLP